MHDFEKRPKYTTTASLDEVLQENTIDDSVPDIGEPGRLWSILKSPLWLCLGVALAIRIWLTIRTHGTMDGDEALLGIQAQHILQGERPIYFYGIPYFGSLEAYLAAILFSIFGSSVAALRVLTTAFGLILVCITWWLASWLALSARLPAYARRCFVTVAALLAALPPLYDGIIEMRTGGGWIESFVIMLLLVTVVYRLTMRWNEGASNKEMAWRWAGLGFVIGFGMWIYPLISVAILASALWIVINRVVAIGRGVMEGKSLPLASFHSLQKLPLVVAAIPTCVIGFTPGIIWGLENNWANIHYIFGLGGGWNLKRLQTIQAVGSKYKACVAPRVIGGGTPLEGRLLTFIHQPLLLVSVACILISVAMLLASLYWRAPLLLRARTLVGLPALLGGSSALLYCISSASAAILISCNADFGGRYASPLVLALPFFLATVFTLAVMFISERRRDGDLEVSGFRRSGRPSVFGLVAMSLLLGIFLVGQAATYGLTNADLAFQSAYCTIAPGNYGPILDYLLKEHIRYVWGTNLLVYPVSFKTNNQVIVADPIARLHPKTTINRIPAYTNAVASADRPSFMILITHGEAHPSLTKLLDARHITYKTAVFPSQPGIDVMVVTPTSSTVSPLTSSDFDIFYCMPQ